VDAAQVLRANPDWYEAILIPGKRLVVARIGGIEGKTRRDDRVRHDVADCLAKQVECLVIGRGDARSFVALYDLHGHGVRRYEVAYV
jgi:hypothetical protein